MLFRSIGSYPVDIQPTASQRYGTVIGAPDRYAIPFRCLVPLRVENMLVVGRSASYTSLAAGSARVIPIGMACAEGAGVAAAYSVKNNISFRNMTKDTEAIVDIQNTLIDQGAYLDDFDLPEPIMSHWAYDGVKTLRSLGILDGGYSNNYRLDESLSRWRYQNMINAVLKKAGITVDYIEVNDNPPARQIIGTMTRALGPVENDYNVQMDVLREKGIMTEQLEPYFVDRERNPDVAEVVVLVANMYNYIMSTK